MPRLIVLLLLSSSALVTQTAVAATTGNVSSTTGELVAATTGTTGAPTPVCGNGIIEDGEQCDDGNVRDTDGCSFFCVKENACCFGCVMLNATQSWCYSAVFPNSNATCTEFAETRCSVLGGAYINSSASFVANGTCDTACTGQRCGDGRVDPGEDCDDMNAWPYDNCSLTCKFQPISACCLSCLNLTSNETVSGSCENYPSTLCSDINYSCENGTYFPGGVFSEQSVCLNASVCPAAAATPLATTGTTGTTGTSGTTGTTGSTGSTGSTTGIIAAAAGGIQTEISEENAAVDSSDSPETQVSTDAFTAIIISVIVIIAVLFFVVLFFATSSPDKFD